MRDLSLGTQSNQRHILTTFRVNLGLLAMVLALSLVYLFSITAMATTNYKIKKLSNDLAVLESEHKKLELQNSTLQSVSTIQQQTALLNFVPATNVTYVKDDNFALK